MKKNSTNSIILLFIVVFLTIGCKALTQIDRDDPRALQAQSGRFKVIRTLTELHGLYREVHQKIYVDGKEWSPDYPDKNTDDGEDNKFAERVSCSTSPNPNVEMLLCTDRENRFYSTYFLRMKDDKPEVVSLGRIWGGVWTDDDGRWLLYKTFYYNVETDEKIAVKGVSFADDENIDYEKDDSLSHTLDEYVVGISPDRKTLIGVLDRTPIKKGAEEFVTLEIIDTKTGSVEKRTFSLTKNPWLKYYKDVENHKFARETSKKFVWEKGADGKDKIVAPQLLEIMKPKKGQK